MLVQPAPAMAAGAPSGCGPVVAGVVTCPAGVITNGVSYAAGADGLTLNVPADATVSNTDHPGVEVAGTTGAVTVNAKGVTGNGNGNGTDVGGLGLFVHTTSGAITVDAEDVKSTGLLFAGSNWTNDAITAYSDTGDVSVTARNVSTVGTYTSAVTASAGTGDVTVNVDSARSTGVGGVTVGGRSLSTSPTNVVIGGGAITATMNHVEAANGSTGVNLNAYGDIDFTSGSIVSAGGPFTSEFGKTFFGGGLQARSYAGDITGVSESIASTGKRDYGMTLRADLGDATVTSGALSTTGDGAFGISVLAGGTAKVVATTTSTLGHAIYENGANRLADAINVSGGTAMIVESGTASATGHGASAIYANGAGSISITSGTATASGGAASLNSVQRFANGISALSTGGGVDIVSGLASTTGNGSWAIYGSAANGVVNITSTTATTTGAGARAIYANGGGGVKIVSGTASTTGGTLGNAADAIMALTYSKTANIDIDSGAVSTLGDGARGISATTDTGGIKIKSGTASTQGSNAFGIFASGATTDVVSGVITTKGVAATGLVALAKNDVTVVSDRVTTQTMLSPGIVGRSLEGKLSINSGSVETFGASGAGISATGATGVTLVSDSVIVHGENAKGVVALSSLGDISIDSGDVQVLGYGQGDAIFAQASAGAVSIKSDSIVSYIGRSIYANGKSVMIDSGTVTFGSIFATATDDIAIVSKAIQSATLIAQSTNGKVSVVSGLIASDGWGVDGILVNGTKDVTIVSDTITINGGPVNTGSGLKSSQGISVIGSNGPVSIDSHSVTTVGDGAAGIVVAPNNAPFVYGSPHVPAGGTGTVNIVSDTISTRGGNAVGIWVENAGKVTIDSGEITTATASGINVYGQNGIDITSDKITAAAGGMFAYTREGALSITSGEITVGEHGDMGIYGVSTTGDITINAGTTHTTNLGMNGSYTADAIGAWSSGGGKITINSLDASAVGTFASAIYGVSDGGAVVINSGKARADSDRTVGVLGRGDVVTINSQDVEIGGTGAVALQSVSYRGDTVVTSGRAVATDANGKGLQIFSGHGATLTITGETSGDLLGASVSAMNRATVTVAKGASVTSSSGIGLLLNAAPIRNAPIQTPSVGYGANVTTAGYISGGAGAKAVQFGDGADSLTVLASASFGGAIDAGGGIDTLTLNGAGQTTAQTLADVTGFETATVQAGQFTLTRDTSFGSTTVSGGKLVVAQSLTSDVTVGAGGTLQIGAGGTTGALTGDLAITGTVIFNRSDEYDYAGDITGSGDLIKQGNQRLVLSGFYGFTGTTTVQGGTVRILHLPSTAEVQVDNGLLDLSGLTQTVTNLSGGSTGSISIDGGALTVNQASATTFAGAITGSGSFTITGGGVIELSGANTYTGDTTVSAGKLKINGSVTSDVTVGASGALGGSGTIGGDVVVQSGGQVTPGNSPGTLHVAGDFTFATGSVYQAEVLPTGEHDLIAVGGVTTIQTGATVQVLAGGTASQYARLSQYGIVTSAGGITGKFSGVTSNMAFLTPSLTYSANAIRLNLLRNDIRFASFATTRNQVGVANAAEALGLGKTVYDSLVIQSAAGSAQGYDALDGQIHADVSTLLVSGAERLRAAVQGRAALPAEAVGGWGDVLAGWNRVDASAGAAGVKANTSGLVVGGDTLLGATRVGLAAAYGEGRATITARGSQAESTSGELAAYAASTLGPVRASVGGGYAWSSIDTTRAVFFPGAQDRVKGKYDARTAQLFAQVSVPLTVGPAAIEPFVSGAYLSVKSDDLTETGGFAALNVQGGTRELGVVDVGVKLKTDLGVGATTVLRPRASIAWRMTTGDLTGETSNAFAGGATRFVVTGAKYGAGAVALQLGADLVSGDKARFGVTYDATYGDRYQSQTIRAGGSWRF
ncbi:autotransporter domain-containing protein [Caulobacter sp. AP07]|uniref:autotransporter domain-containing protein n=1 Tax=Caulobacter sp. AP07 TaxID=1144304 RepID=UPI0012FC6F60|nr:autotransporter domain-containing protein [Caulobacter sp. AP07]